MLYSTELLGCISRRGSRRHETPHVGCDCHSSFRFPCTPVSSVGRSPGSQDVEKATVEIIADAGDVKLCNGELRIAAVLFTRIGYPLWGLITAVVLRRSGKILLRAASVEWDSAAAP